MDAPRGSVEHAEELARLRRRAYGPDADIMEDRAAQARLSELEAAQRRRRTPVGDAGTGVVAPNPGPAPVAETIEGSRSASASVSQPVGEALAEQERARTSVIRQDPATGSSADSDAIDRAPPAPWWRRRPALLVGGAIATLAVNAAFTASTLQLLADQTTPIPAETATKETPPVPSGQGGQYVPAPDHVLALKSDGAAADQPSDPGGKLNALGIGPDELKRYEDFQGPDVWNDTNVWSGESRYGMTCLLVAVSGQPISDGGRAAEGCSLRGSDTIADLMGTDSLTRLVLKGDHIDVYVYEGGADPNAS